MHVLGPLARVRNTGIVATIRAPSDELLVDVAEALLAGGVNVMEVTFTIPGAVSVLEKVADRLGDRPVENMAVPVGEAGREVCRLAHAQGKRVWVNQFYRVEVLRDVDGTCHEYDYPRGLSYLSPYRPASAWHADRPYGGDLLEFEAQMKLRLQTALFPQMIAHSFPISQQPADPEAADMLEVYAPLFGPLPKPPWFTAAWQLAYIVAVRLLAGILGNVLLWGGTILFPAYGRGEAYWNLAPLADQQTAGAIMMVEGSFLTLGLFAYLFLLQ